MKTAYRAYCRSVNQASCAPWAMVIAVFLMLAFVLGVGHAVETHASETIAVARGTAAALLCASAAVIGLTLLRLTAGARGTHFSYHVGVIPQPERVIIGEHADGSPATAEVGSYTWKIRPPAPERVPGKSDLVSQRAAEDEAAGLIQRDGNRVKWTADATSMKADADALADDNMEILVNRHGTVFECAEPPADLLEGP